MGHDLETFRSSLFKKKYLPQVKPFPCVRELFQTIKADGQRFALASSAKGDELPGFSTNREHRCPVQVETSSADAERSKPHPDIFEAALQKLGADVPREKVIVVGDSPHDAEAARKANLRTVGVLCGGFPEDVLTRAGCIAIFKDPEDLLRHFGSVAPSQERKIETVPSILRGSDIAHGSFRETEATLQPSAISPSRFVRNAYNWSLTAWGQAFRPAAAFPGGALHRPLL